MGNLKAAIALLPDRALSNRLATAALIAHGATGGRLRWPRLPAHLSLQKPFSITSLAPVERYCESLARELPPLTVALDAVDIQLPSPNGPEAVVWVGVRECPALLDLKQRLDRELRPFVSDANAPLDGDEQAFHLTLGFLPGASLTSPEQLPNFEGSPATLHELGLFLYDGLPRAGWQCMLYSRQPLGGGALASVVLQEE